MEFLPTTLGTRPRLAVEVRTEGVVAARAEDAAALLSVVSRAGLAVGAVVPGLKAGAMVDRAAVVAAVRSVLDGVVGRGAERSRDVTLVVPDATVRVLLLDFDQLPSKPVEALPVVRFRLKKLLPFDADDAVISYQVMSSGKSGVRVLAVAMPREVLNEYEGVVTSAGYLPGTVLPSTLAALAGLDESDSATLVVNAGLGQVTTAIVRAGILLLHRALDTTDGKDVEELTEEAPLDAGLWNVDDAGDEYDRLDAAAAVQAGELKRTGIGYATASARAMALEVTQAVSVAAAYFEDTLEASPEIVLAAGTTGAEVLQAMLLESGLEGLRVRELVEPGMMEAEAVTSTVPRGWLAGVRGALKG
jgi:type IV pilus assembly protein PilM